MSQLLDELNLILQEKQDKIKPENIKKGIQIFDIEGTYEGDTSSTKIKLFETQEEMQQDPNANKGDLAVVYREEIQNMTADSQTQFITFPETVTLPQALMESYYCRLRATNPSKMFDGNIMLDQNSFRFDGFTDTGMVRVSYTSNDGITYIREEFMGDNGELTNPVDLGTEIHCEMQEEWNDNFGYFMQIGENTFEGLYEYESYNDSSYNRMYNKNLERKLFKYPDDFLNYKVVTPTYTFPPIKDWVNTSDYNNNNNIWVEEYEDKGKYAVPTKFKVFYNLASKNTCILTDGSTFNLALYDFSDSYEDIYDTAILTYDSSLEEHISLQFTTNESSFNQLYNILLNSITTYNYTSNAKKIADVTNCWVAQLTSYNNFDLYEVPDFTSSVQSTDASSDLNIDYSVEMYKPAKTQLNATKDLVYNSIYYGKDGIEEGTLTQNVSLLMDDINAEVYYKLVDAYSNAKPIVLQNNTNIPKNIRFIPTNLQGESLWDTSQMTNTTLMFYRCNHLTEVPSLNTSNVTNMHSMFEECTSLVSVSFLDTSKVTDMYYMFEQCINLTSIPQLDTSNVTDMSSMFSYCTSLVTLPQLNMSSIIKDNLSVAFSKCPALSNDSLNNILASLLTATSYTGAKTLNHIGLSEEQAQKCTTLSNWSALEAKGWTTGY